MALLPVILTFVGYYIPGYKAGGAIQSVANIADQLGDSFEFKIVARDRDSGDVRPYPEVEIGRWQPVGNAKVCYVPPERQALRDVVRIMQETPHDLVYLNSFFEWRFTTLPLLARRIGGGVRRPVVLAPRGEFSRSALQIKRSKKRAFLAMSRAMGLHQDVLWHASSEHEERDIRRVFGRGVRVHVASDLPKRVPPAVKHEPREPGASLRVLFLSRISPMKNLSFLLGTLARVSVPVDCSIVGFIDTPDYWKACEAQISTLPEHVRVHYRGPVSAPEVPEVMAQHDLLFLPTLGENFGHVVIEALAAGTPVLISDRTPWKDVEEHGAGWALPLSDEAPFRAIIERLYHEDLAASVARRDRALAYAGRFLRSETLLDANRALFWAALSEEA